MISTPKQKELIIFELLAEWVDFNLLIKADK